MNSTQKFWLAKNLIKYFWSAFFHTEVKLPNALIFYSGSVSGIFVICSSKMPVLFLIISIRYQLNYNQVFLPGLLENRNFISVTSVRFKN